MAQNRQDYYVSIKPEFALGTIQKTTNSDETLTLSMNNTGFATFLNAKPVYYFEKAFPTAVLEKNKRVYKIILDNDTHLNDFSNREEVEFVEIIEDLDIALYIPNDYDYIDRAGPNTALELIKAPLAWNLSTGSSNVLAGVVDSNFNIYHEDIENKIAQIFVSASLNPDDGGNFHGTIVSSALASESDNNKGVASIGYSTNLIITTGGGIDRIHQLSQLPGVRVINISRKWGCTFFQTIENMFEDIWTGNELYPPVVIVAAAGNGKINQAASGSGWCEDENGEANGYVYPAAYSHVIAVSSVSHLVPRGTQDVTLDYGLSWEDVHKYNINNPNSTHTNNDKVDIVAPGFDILVANNGIDNYKRDRGTSVASPMVAGVIALMFGVNPDLTSNQVRDIIKSTADDIYHIPLNQPYIGRLGTGRLNAYRAVLTAKCMADPNYAPNLDLMIRNSLADYGDEPDNNTQQVFWNSQDIWVRNQQDGKAVRTHQNPEYDPTNPNYVYVRVTNRSCITSSGNDSLELYWAKSHAAPSIWPDLWDGSMSIDGVTLGGQIATVSIPELTPGKEAIIEIPWLVPNPEDFQNIGTQPWHFCLVAKIVSEDDPATFETSSLPQNVINSNNFAWKNLNIVDIIPNTVGVGSITAVANPFSQSKTYKLVFKTDENEPGSPIYEEAEVGVELDDVLFDAWVRGGRQGSGFLATSNGKKLIATDNDFTLDNIQFLANEFGTAYVTFNFLTKKLTNKTIYNYHVIQKDYSTNEMVGGVTYEVRKQPRPAFTANAGNDEEIDKSESVTLQASDINEDAIYNWYDIEGNLIYTGTTITVSPQFSQQYKLEVISNLDGLKDYDELQVIVNPYKIQSIVPNPATSTVTVNYIADEANSAYLMLVHQNTGNTSNYIIDTEENSHTIDLSNMATGLYSIILVCDGVIQGSNNLLKQ
jgi:hypothetical protein